MITISGSLENVSIGLNKMTKRDNDPRGCVNRCNIGGDICAVTVQVQNWKYYRKSMIVTSGGFERFINGLRMT